MIRLEHALNFLVGFNHSKMKVKRGIKLLYQIKDAAAPIWLYYCWQKYPHLLPQPHLSMVHIVNLQTQDDVHAKNCLGFCYNDGIVVDQNNEVAFGWYSKAAEQNYSIAENNLAYCYHNGIGTAKDLDKAIFYYTKSAQQGYAYACLILARILQSQNMTEQAIFWYTKAAAQNIDGAKKILRYLTRPVIKVDQLKIMPKDKPNNDEINMACCICADQNRNTVCLPCRHMSMCFNCTKDFLERQKDCPICRKPIENIVKVYL